MDVITLLAKAAADKHAGIAGEVLKGLGKGIGGLYGKAWKANPLATAMGTAGVAGGGHYLGQQQLQGLKKQHGNLYEAQQAIKPWAWGSGGGLKTNIGNAANSWMGSPLGSLYAALSGGGKKQDIISGSRYGKGVETGDWVVDPVTGVPTRSLSGRETGRLGSETQQRLQDYNQARNDLRSTMGEDWYQQQTDANARRSAPSGGGMTPDQQELLNRVQYYFGPKANFKLHGMSRLGDPWNASN